MNKNRKDIQKGYWIGLFNYKLINSNPTISTS